MSSVLLKLFAISGDKSSLLAVEMMSTLKARQVLPRLDDVRQSFKVSILSA